MRLNVIISDLWRKSVKNITVGRMPGKHQENYFPG
jgi:hypothetical protein